jgi:hypothetical protein
VLEKQRADGVAKIKDGIENSDANETKHLSVETDKERLRI